MFDFDKLTKDLGLTQKVLADSFGVSPQAVTKAKKGEMEIPKAWINILEGEYKVNTREYYIKKEPIKPISEDPNGKEIPFFNQEVYGTISPVLDDHVTMQPYAIKKIPMFMQADGAVQVKGHSMKGYINHGDWVVIKKITNRNFIIFGEPYLIITKSDNLKTVKFVKESMDDPDCLCLTPYNIEQFEPQDIPKKEILEMYAVVGLFRSM
jgi:SOS-response transcriptional repressor LexA